ncbi:MAG: Gamma-glutamyltranspeptidase @ Glutathione hydrolase, partial [uncultured Actinomycetospora sp.]
LVAAAARPRDVGDRRRPRARDQLRPRRGPRRPARREHDRRRRRPLPRALADLGGPVVARGPAAAPGRGPAQPGVGGHPHPARRCGAGTRPRRAHRRRAHGVGRGLRRRGGGRVGPHPAPPRLGHRPRRRPDRRGHRRVPGAGDRRRGRRVPRCSHRQDARLGPGAGAARRAGGARRGRRRRARPVVGDRRTPRPRGDQARAGRPRRVVRGV